MRKIKYSKELLEAVVRESLNWRTVCERIGLKPFTGNESYLKIRCQKFGIDFSHFPGKGWGRGKPNLGKRKAIDEYLKKNVHNITSNTLRRYLIEAELKRSVCEECELEVWCGNPIRFQLHHKNGDHFDNTFTNLEILCPNCHSLTDNFRGKNKRGNSPIGRRQQT